MHSYQRVKVAAANKIIVPCILIDKTWTLSHFSIFRRNKHSEMVDLRGFSMPPSFVLPLYTTVYHTTRETFTKKIDESINFPFSPHAIAGRGSSGVAGAKSRERSSNYRERDRGLPFNEITLRVRQLETPACLVRREQSVDYRFSQVYFTIARNAGE